MCAATRRTQRRVDLLDHLSQLEVRVLRRQLEFENESVELVDAEHHGHALGHKVADKLLRGRAHALDGVNDEERAVGESQGRAHLVRKVDVPRSVDQVEHVVLLAR